MTVAQQQNVDDCKEENADLVCKMPSGFVVMGKSQFLRGYCILRSDPVVGSINDLRHEQRAQFLEDMVLIGDAIMEVTGAYRMNYFIAGNFDPLLHAHIVPRYLSEPEQYRKGLPWLYPGFEDEAAHFDLARDASLKLAIEKSIQKHVQIRSNGRKERTEQ